VVSKITFSGAQKGNITVSIEIEGNRETRETATFASFNVPQIVDETPYILSDSRLILDGLEVKFKSFTIVIDNVLDVDRYLNCPGREDIPSTDRVVTASFELPYNVATDVLHDLPPIGIAGQLSFTNGTASTVFDFPRMQAPAETPTGSTRGDELMLDLEFACKYVTEPNDELVITHNV